LSSGSAFARGSKSPARRHHSKKSDPDRLTQSAAGVLRRGDRRRSKSLHLDSGRPVERK